MTCPTILFNCSTNNIGGGVKNSALFIVEALNADDAINWHFAISYGVRELLIKYDVTFDERFYVFDDSPSRNIASRRNLKALEKKIRPDLVYTMAGPAYVKFVNYHVLGLSSAYITHPDRSIFKLKKSLPEKVKLVAHIAFQIYHSTKANHFIFQTNEARKSFSRNTKIDINRTSVINNAFDSGLLDVLLKLKETPIQRKGPLTIFCPGAAYDHKGFQYIPRIANELSKLTDIPFKFVLTLPESTLLNQITLQINQFEIEPFISNIGPFEYSKVADLYSEADIVFVPSLLETFSATYLEAMIAKKILVVADKSFAKDVCKDAATYVDPFDAVGTAKTFADILQNPHNFSYKLELGQEIFKQYGSQKRRYQEIVRLLIVKCNERIQLDK